MSEKRTINIKIADIPLSLNIDPSDEEIVRRAAKEINERVLKYKRWACRAGTSLFLGIRGVAAHH